MRTSKAYTVAYKLYSADTIRYISLLAYDKADAWDKAFYEEIPKATGDYPYSAWVESVTYQNGNERRFNTHEGKPY